MNKNIFYDENMPYAEEFFAGFGQLVPFAGRELTAETIAGADALLVRSITNVNEQLLGLNSELSFVGTATIGVDHIDHTYLSNRDISFSSAPGCNAVSVAEYVISSLVVMAERYQMDLFSLKVGIVGAGNTGSRLADKLDALGIAYLLCDPLLAAQGDNRKFVELTEVLNCDVVSLHVPLTKSGQHPTYHLLDQERLHALSDKQILINACRGEVVDNQALLQIKKNAAGPKLVWDVWENEPNILHELIEYTDIATAHIAGYSLEGKARGTEMLYQALCKCWNLPIEKQLNQLLPKASITNITINHNFDENVLNQLVKMVYDVRRDDAIFRQQIKTQGFDHIRKTYPARREFSSVSINLDKNVKRGIPPLLGFSHVTN